MNYNELTIVEARKKLDDGSLTAVDLTRACLDKIKTDNSRLNACLTVCDKLAMKQATQADARLAKGEKGGLLGIPYLCKDNILTKGIKTTASSKMLKNYKPAFSATVIKKFEQAGAVLLGKTNLDEFAHGSSTETSFFGPTKNSFDQARVPGGSSGGSATAVSANFCLFAIGSDTGGSIRHPASFCGVVGLKPSYGLVSRFGLIAMTSSTDVIGPLTKTVADADLVLDTLVGYDELDATTVNLPSEHYENNAGDLSGIKIGLAQEYFPAELDSEIKQAVMAQAEKLKARGAEIIDVSLPHTKYSVSVYYIITPSEISANLARFDGVRYGFNKKQVVDLNEFYAKGRGAGFGDEVKRRIMLGTFALSAGYHDQYYLQAQKVRAKIIEDFDKVFVNVDLLLTPTTPTTAFALGSKSDPLSMYLEDLFLAPASLAGLPAISVPVGLSSAGLPMGAQLIGKRLGEKRLLTVAGMLNLS